MLSVLKSLSKSKINIFLFIVTSLFVFLFFSLLTHIPTIKNLITAGVQKTQVATILLQLVFNFVSVTSLFNLVLIIFISLLIALNIVLIIEFLRKRKNLILAEKKFEHTNNILTNIIALLLALFGAGCASCGIFILSYIFGLAGANTILSFLPFAGLEFNILSIIILLVSNYVIIKKLQSPLICAS